MRVPLELSCRAAWLPLPGHAKPRASCCIVENGPSGKEGSGSSGNQNRRRTSRLRLPQPTTNVCIKLKLKPKSGCGGRASLTLALLWSFKLQCESGNSRARSCFYPAMSVGNFNPTFGWRFGMSPNIEIFFFQFFGFVVPKSLGVLFVLITFQRTFSLMPR